MPGEVEESLQPHSQFGSRLKQSAEQLAGRLNRSFCPSKLLRANRIDVDRQLRWSRHLPVVHEGPPRELRSVAQVEVLGQCIAFPSTRLLDAISSPDACRAVEIDEAVAPVSRELFDDEMRVEAESLESSQKRRAFVQIRPSGLNHTHSGTPEMRQEHLQKLAGRHEVGIENCDQIAGSRSEPVVEGAGLESRPVAPLNVDYVDPPFSPECDAISNQHAGIITRIVEDLDLEQSARVRQLRAGVEQSLYDVPLIVDRQLNGDLGKHRRVPRGYAVWIPLTPVFRETPCQP